MTTHVAIGASSWRDYQFLSPITALLWRERIGFNPIVLRVGNWEEKGRGRTALAALEELKIKHVQIAAIEGLEEATIAQNVRQHAAAFVEDQDSWIMPADADLWPLKKDFYQQHVNSAKRAVCYYGNGDHYQTIPTCHVAMKAKDWREVYGIGNGRSLEGQIKHNFDAWIATYRDRWPWTDRGFAVWMSDQAMMTDLLRAQPWFTTETLMIERRGHPPVDRIDRGVWPTEQELDAKWGTWVDAHVFKAPDEPGQWPRVRALINRLLPHHSDWAERYHEEYIKGY